MSSDPQLPERAARNQARFRDYNEHIEPHNAAHHWVDPPYADWVCECANEECLEPVRLTVSEYETVRTDPAHFLIAPGDWHVVPEVERVLVRHERYWIVEKEGDAAEETERLDNRATEAASPADEVLAHAADRNPWNVPTPKRA
jgi:hypothetical protein